MNPKFLIVDLFCGFGGTTTGFEMAMYVGPDGKLYNAALVIACVNHDPKAIKSHWMNHSNVKHFNEDIRTLNLTELVSLVNYYRIKYPDAKLILWASLECTNFSKAKGGRAREADSRTLAEHLERYVIALDPDFIQIENVVEFMSWGPLDDKGKPISRKNGENWLKWREVIKSYGYHDGWRELNSANFGAYTSRNRLFGIFAKHGLPIVWPEPTHAKKVSKHSMYGDLKKWMPVKEVLDFSDEGESIFNRKKDLSGKTLERIFAGLIKYIANGDKSFISKYYSGKPSGKKIPIDGPAGTIRCRDGQALVQAEFLLKYNSTNKQTGVHNPPSVNDPAPVVSCQGRLGLIQPQFLMHYYSNGGEISSIDNPHPTITTRDGAAMINPEFLVNYNHSSDTNNIEDPAPTLVTRDKLAKVKLNFFIDKQFGKYAQNQSIHVPAGALLPTDKHRLIEAVPFVMPTNFNNLPKSIEEPAPTITADRHHHYLINPSWGGNPGSIEQPCPVIIARQDKAPLYCVKVETGVFAVPVYDTDSEIMVKIKTFMAVYGLVDIKMRMLRVKELLKIQGFPENYKMVGNQSDHKKFIGNSVVPLVVKNWCEAYACKLFEDVKLVA